MCFKLPKQNTARREDKNKAHGHPAHWSAEEADVDLFLALRFIIDRTDSKRTFNMSPRTLLNAATFTHATKLTREKVTWTGRNPSVVM